LAALAMTTVPVPFVTSSPAPIIVDSISALTTPESTVMVVEVPVWSDNSPPETRYEPPEAK